MLSSEWPSHLHITHDALGEMACQSKMQADTAPPAAGRPSVCPGQLEKTLLLESTKTMLLCIEDADALAGFSVKLSPCP